VAPMTIPGIERLCDVLKELLALVARRGVENGDEEDFQKQRVAIRELRDAAEHGDIPGYLEATVQYLVISLKATRNPLLEQILLDMWPATSRVQYAALLMEKKKLKSNVRYFAAATDHFHRGMAEEAAQVIRELALATLQPGTRCVHCNEPLLQTTAEEVAGDVPAYVLQTQTVFHRCPACGRVFWRGTHWRGIEERLRAFD